MEKVLIDKLKGLLTLIIPFMGFILPQKLEDRLTSRSELGNESANVLQMA